MNTFLKYAMFKVSDFKCQKECFKDLNQQNEILKLPNSKFYEKKQAKFLKF